jgi:hypothetical protein
MRGHFTIGSWIVDGPAPDPDNWVYRRFMMADHDPLLEERQKTHGSFAENAKVYVKFKAIFFHHLHGVVKDEHTNALDMIALKLSRILSGQANFKDHWDDIAGYAKLASKACDK